MRPSYGSQGRARPGTAPAIQRPPGTDIDTAGADFWARPSRVSLPGRAAGELADDVEVADMTRVLLEQVEQDPFQRGRIRPVPPGPGLAGLGQVVGLDDGPGAFRPGAQRRGQRLQRLIGSDVPPAVALVAPRVADVAAALEPPLQPAHLDVGQVLEQVDGGPARRQPARAQLGG